jgi:hypothetical protein
LLFGEACGARPVVLEEIAKISTRKLEEKKRAIVHYYFVFTAGLQAGPCDTNQFLDVAA